MSVAMTGSAFVIPEEGRNLTAAGVWNASVAMLTGKKVSEEVVQERMAICSVCEHVRSLPSMGGLYCGLCSCNLSADMKAIINMAALEEELPAFGCKHEKRAEGRGWRR
jgi:hypothetical protein